jgi:importin-9
MFTSLLSDVLKSLASSRNAGVYETVVKQALPPLSEAVKNASDDASWIPQSALDLVTALASGAPEAGLGEGFFSILAPGLFSCLKVVEDRDTLQVCATVTQK